MEDKQLIDYKIFVFDLDDTLVLHKVNRKYSLDYNRKIRKFLSYLKNQGKYLYIASHNREPDEVLDKNGISLSYFHDILGETKLLSKHVNKIEEYTNKKDMIIEILNRHRNLSKDDVVFFDDRVYNIKQVESINVKCILVDKYTGLVFF
jgi:HAD superfamily phosphatase (TIGR01681 family)